MDLYFLDENLRRVDVFDEYSSLIWTERFIPPGEFILEMVYTPDLKNKFQRGKYLWLKGSKIFMRVDLITIAAQDLESGRTKILKVQGTSYEYVLDGRIITPGVVPLKDGNGNDVVVSYTGTPAELIRSLIIRAVTATTDDAVSYFTTTDIAHEGSIPSGDSFSIRIPPSPVLATVHEIADAWLVGWRFERVGDGPRVKLVTYMGDDRSSRQTVFAPVVFSEAFGNLDDSTMLESDREFYNTAYVYSDTVAVIAYDQAYVTPPTGNDRRVMYLEASNLADGLTTAQIQTELARQGRNALSTQRVVYGFDGSASEETGYTYGVDYNLGDIVELRDDFGNKIMMRVTEHTFTIDSDGKKSYPTLSNGALTTAGSWLDYNPTQMWTDVPDDADHEWTDLP